LPISEYLRALRSKVGHELLLMPSVTMIVRDDKDRILLVKIADADLWMPPGGSIEPNESPKDAAVREMKEETGLIVEPFRIIDVYGGPECRVVYPNGDIVSYVMTVFECDVISGEAVPDHEETVDIRYFSESDATSIPIPPWARTVLRDAFRSASTGSNGPNGRPFGPTRAPDG
jgi:8-oxo-dGTP pyrophosphatase MutT (NUDIX family)